MNKFLIALLTIPTLGLAGCASTGGRTYQTNNAPQPVYSSSQDETNKKIIKQGLLGAATGAIAAEASGGSAGKGALIGAGTNVIGGAILDTLTTPQSQPVYYSQAPNTNRIVRKFDSDGHVISEETFTR